MPRITPPLSSMTDKPSDPAVEAVYSFIRAYIDEHGYPPSLREIGAHCYIGRSTVLLYLDRLEARGRISRDPGKARSINLLGAKSDAARKSGQMVGQMFTHHKNVCAKLKRRKEDIPSTDT